MKIERCIFAVACVFLQSAAPVFSSEQPEPVVSLESSNQAKESFGAVLKSDGLRGAYSSMVSGLQEAISSPTGSKTLTVHIDRAADLHGEDTIGTSDVYVEVKVYKDNWVHDQTFGEDKTRVVESLNPVFNQDFQFLIPSTDDMVLELKVMDEDPGLDDTMGECEVKLDDYTLSSTPTSVEKVLDHHILSENEKIYFTLKLE